MKIDIKKIEIKGNTLMIYTLAMTTATKIVECITHQLGTPHITGVVRLSEILDYMREEENIDLPKDSVYGYGFRIPGDVVFSIDWNQERCTLFGSLYRLMVWPVSIVDNKEFCKGVKEGVDDPDVKEILNKIHGTFEKGRRVLFDETFNHDRYPIGSDLHCPKDGKSITTDECARISKSTTDRYAALEALAASNSWEFAVYSGLIARIISDTVRDSLRDGRGSEDDRCANCPGRSRKSESGGHASGCGCCSEPSGQSGVSE